MYYSFENERPVVERQPAPVANRQNGGASSDPVINPLIDLGVREGTLAPEGNNFSGLLSLIILIS